MTGLASPRLWLAAVSILAWACGAHAKRPPQRPRLTQLVSAPADVPDPGWAGETGVASYYGRAQNGRLTAAGIPFNEAGLTAAHPWLPFGTQVRVTLEGTDRSVIVTITDRLHSSRRIVDLSLGAARYLGMIRQGVAVVSLSPA